MFNPSAIAACRMVEEKCAEDPEYRRKLEKTGKPLRSQVRRLSDEALIEKLGSLGVPMNRERLEPLLGRFFSAEEMAAALEPETPSRGKEGIESDWLWMALVVLWERWFPDRPNAEMLDDKMQEGYGQEEKNSRLGCETWLEAWRMFLRLIDQWKIGSIREFDDRFRGSQAVFNWVQDLETALWNAGLDERDLLEKRIAYCEEYLERFGAEEPSITQGMRIATAETHAELGQMEKAEGFFRQWLAEDPQWGWGWIGWSDQYGLTRRPERRNFEKALQILNEALAVKAVRDKRDILERLEDVYKELGRPEEAREVQRRKKEFEALSQALAKEEKRARSISGLLQPDDPEMPSPQLPPRQKIGRNDPCPCGSGKKYKKCCGR